MKKKAKEHILLYKILYSLMVMFVYMIGRNIPLYGVDVEAYRDVDINAQSIIIQAVSGDMKNCSILWIVIESKECLEQILLN